MRAPRRVSETLEYVSVRIPDSEYRGPVAAYLGPRPRRRCRSCPALAVLGRTLCRDCLDHQAALAATRRREKRRAGLCTCGGAEPEPGRVHCRRCLDLFAATKRTRHRTNRRWPCVSSEPPEELR